MDDGQELADVVRTIQGTKVEDLLETGEVYSSVLHLSGIAATSGVHGQGLLLQVGREAGRNRLFRSLWGTCLADIVGRRRGKRFFGLLQRVERLVFCACVAFGLQLAIRPGAIDAWGDACPDDIEFLFLYHKKGENLLQR